MAATDIVKLVIAAAMVVAGIAGYYLLAANSIVLRLLAVVAGIVAGVAAAWTMYHRLFMPVPSKTHQKEPFHHPFEAGIGDQEKHRRHRSPGRRWRPSPP